MVKSDFQKRMEEQGWEFLTNEYLLARPNYDGGWDFIMPLYKKDGTLIHKPRRSQIEHDYKSRGFREVQVVDTAFNIHGNPLEHHVAIYVKQ